MSPMTTFPVDVQKPHQVSRPFPQKGILFDRQLTAGHPRNRPLDPEPTAPRAAASPFGSTGRRPGGLQAWPVCGSQGGWLDLNESI